MGRSAWSEHRSELETPCALRLGEPNQDGVTSDVLCRTASLTQELLSRLRQDPSALHLATKLACLLRRARLLYTTACLRLLRFALRTPSVGLMFNLAAEPSPCAIIIHGSRLELCTRSRNTYLPSVSRKSRCASLPTAVSARLTAHLNLVGKMLRTDFCNRPSIRALVVRPTPKLPAYAGMTAPIMNSEALATAPSRSAASRPPYDNLNPRWINV
jgi:hypothetical protein